MEKSRGRTGSLSYCFPYQLAGLCIDHVDRLAFRVVGAYTGAQILVRVIAATENEHRLRTAADIDQTDPGGRKRQAKLGKVAGFVDGPQQFGLRRIADIQGIVGLATAPQANIQVDLIARVDRAVVILILVVGDR